jgi:hypothetical protein
MQVAEERLGIMIKTGYYDISFLNPLPLAKKTTFKLGSKI